MAVISEYLNSHGIDPFLGGLIVGIVVCALVRVGIARNRAEIKDPFGGGAASGPPAAGASTGLAVPRTAQIRIKTGGVERELTAPETANLMQLLDRGEKIAAIKLVREVTGLGLKEAKGLVDGLDTTRRN